MATSAMDREKTGGDNEHDKKLNVTVVYNGIERKFKMQADATVLALLTEAMQEFGVAGQSNFALFTQANARLEANSTLRAAGVTKDSPLVLRPVTAGSGCPTLPLG